MAIAGIVISGFQMLTWVLFGELVAIGIVTSDGINHNKLISEAEESSRRNGYAILDESAISDISWVEDHDHSYLVFGRGNTFKYYASADNLDDYYYEGTYELYFGQEAIEELLGESEDSGIDAEDYYDMLEEYDEYTYANMVLLIVENETCIIDGENTLDQVVETPYYGFYVIDDDDEATPFLVNMNTGTDYEFVPYDDN